MLDTVLATALATTILGLPVPLRLPAEVADVYALKSNPAGLGFISGSELRLVYGRTPVEAVPGPDPRGLDGLGIFGAARVADYLTLAGGFEGDLHPNGRSVQRGFLGLGIGAREASLGLTWERGSRWDGPTKGALSAGLTLRPAAWLATGVAIRDLAQNANRRQYDLGMAIRPFTDRVLLSARWRLTQSQALNSDTLDLTVLARAELLEGLTLGAAINQDADVTAELAINFENLLAGSRVTVADGGGTTVVTELAFRSRRRPGLIKRSKVAVVDLEGTLSADPEFNLLERRFVVQPYGVAPLLLDTLALAEDVRGVLLRIGALEIGWGKAEELRDGIERLRTKGRRVDCELVGSGDLAYFVATACDTIVMAPSKILTVDGLAANVLFFAEGLERIGVKVEAVQRGRYKSSPEQFTRAGMSPAQREALGAYLDAVYGRLIDAVSSGRSMSVGEVEGLIERGTFTATQAVALKLVDQALYPDQVEEFLRKRYDGRVSFVPGRRAVPPRRPRWAGRPLIALIHVDGPITGGESRDVMFGARTVGAETLIAALDYARADPDIRAVVLRVDSPGGDALASDLIARAVRRLNERKPVIASFGDVAASGGYYVAAGARTIYAEPTTLTGSIGVFSMKVSLEGLLAKLGISVATLQRGALANGQSVLKDLTPEERRAVSILVDDAYRQFLDVVAEGRGLQTDEVREVAEGHIWSGVDAKEHKLVDELGGLSDAVRRAKRSVGLSPEQPVALLTLPGNRSQLPSAVRSVMGSVFSVTPPVDPFAELAQSLPHALRELLALVALAGTGDEGAPLALAPYVLEVD